MQKILALAVLALLVFPIATEAQTITGRLDPQYDAESGYYEYGPLYWDVTVAPSGSRSDEFGLNLYYNKVRAAMLVSLLCPDSDGDFERHARSISAEHFISLTTGLSPGDDCVLLLLGLSTRNEVLSYRMRVAELATSGRLRERETIRALLRQASVGTRKVLASVRAWRQFSESDFDEAGGGADKESLSGRAGRQVLVLTVRPAPGPVDQSPRD